MLCVIGVIRNLTSLLCAIDGALARCANVVNVFIGGVYCDCKKPQDECTIVGARANGRMLDRDSLHTDRDSPVVKDQLSILA